jgi:hypothetical protein
MTTVKRPTNLTQYTSVLPYASELFGIYQPLLGWKSQRIQARFQRGFERDKRRLLERLKREFAPDTEVRMRDQQVELVVRPGSLAAARLRQFDSVVLAQIASRLPATIDDDAVWSATITADIVDAILKNDVVQTYTRRHGELRNPDAPLAREVSRAGADNRGQRDKMAAHAFARQLQYESSMAGTLLHLVRHKSFGALRMLFFSSRDETSDANRMLRAVNAATPGEAYLDLETLNPADREHLERVALSPIGVVHLFRQYFFELDTFLGTPENHVWLSPGSSVELIEVHTRKTTVEKTLETAFETLVRSERTTTQEEEISDAVKEDNDQNVKFGQSVTASYGSIEANTSFDYSTPHKQARETTHKRLREQTDKLSSEIRRNFKSTFRMVTEVTHQSSSKHLLANTTDELLNYELRRKMRQIGVQVQDVGTFLCWQTYVDDPGRDLGIAKLLHIAKPPELDGIPHPEEIPLLQPFQEERVVTIPFIPVSHEPDNEGEIYEHGIEADNHEFMAELEQIQADFRQEFVCPKANHQLANVEFDPQGQPVLVSRSLIDNSTTPPSFNLHLASADFAGQNNLQIKLILHWAPTAAANEEIIKKNDENLGAFKAEQRAAYERAYVEAARERVKLASKIVSRSSDELREEERIVVYRTLIQDMLLKGVPMPDDATRHVAAELLNSIFDVDKMLYFVAPEWWRPRLHRSRQQLQETPPRPPRPFPGGAIVNDLEAVATRALARHLGEAASETRATTMASSSVGWGGVSDAERNSYYITEDSDPARFGSSLGWLLQLDGDNMRNAFLNAPWVKTVIPIRPGKEEAAINWLKGVEGMNGITDDVIYHAASPEEKDINGAPLDGRKMIDVLFDLAAKIEKKHQEGVAVGKYPKAGEVSDPALLDEANVVTATPIDRVYEHGFFPLEGGFRLNVGDNYEIFDQWIEILPTDQTVPVEVTYDPKTGRQI